MGQRNGENISEDHNNKDSEKEKGKEFMARTKEKWDNKMP